MKFKVKNLGPITEGELGLGRLTIISGYNNTGKTYLAYLVYFYHYYLSHSIMLGNIDRPNLMIFPKKNQREFMRTGQTSIRLDAKAILTDCGSIIKQISNKLSAELPKAFSSDENFFEKTSLMVEIDDITWGKEISARLDALEKEPFVVGDIELSYYSEHLSVSVVKKRKNGKPIEIDPLSISTVNVILHDYLLTPPYVNPFILTTERTGISLFYRELDENRNALVNSILQMEGKNKTLPTGILRKLSSRYALPIVEEINFVRSLDESNKNKSELRTSTSKPLFKMLTEIMKADYRIDKTGIRYVSQTGNSGKFDIPLYMASAGAKELSSLFFLLKHKVDKGDMLIIEEPESHMSPVNQIQLARVICECVSAGVNVVLTTHSEIMIKEFNNMIMLHELEQQRKLVNRKRKHYRQLTGVDKDNVSAYSCQDSTIVKCEVNPWGMYIPLVDEALLSINQDSVFLSNLVLEMYRDQK